MCSHVRGHPELSNPQAAQLWSLEAGEGAREPVSTGTEFQFYKTEELWGWMVVMAVQQYECA